MTPDETNATSAAPPEFFGNVIAQLRHHWVDSAATDQGVDPDTVRRAIIIGNDRHAEVRLSSDARAALFVGDDQIMDLDDYLLLDSGLRPDIRALVPDVPLDALYQFFDLDLGYLDFDLQPRRDMARRHHRIAGQFMFAATSLLERGGFEAGCENLFAAAELAAMAIMEAADASTRNHLSRAVWLDTHGDEMGVPVRGVVALRALLAARNGYRYGDMNVRASRVDLLELHHDVQELIDAAERQLNRSS